MKKISIMILVLVVAMASCKKTPEVNLKYVDVERDLITVGTTTATVQCDYQYIATLKKAYLYYGEGEDEADMNAAEMRVVQNTLYVDLAGLKESTTYSYYYEFHNGFNSMRTVEKTFKTEGPGVTITLPTVVTAEVTEITTNSAKGGGEVTDDGGAEVTERGICWSTNENPTLSDSHVAVGTGIGAFTALMNGMEAGTTYHVRAYATNEKGTAYGLDREFVTVGGGGSGAPEGAIDGLFSVSPTQKVYFSKGNLQYQASTNTWRFAENQWNYVGSEVVMDGDPGGNVTGSSNHLVSESYGGWIDLFGWGTSDHNHGAVCYQPWSTSFNNSDYYAYGSYTYNLFDKTGEADWGCNAISNGGNLPNQWRTLKQEEMNYVFNNRNVDISFVRAVVNGVKGVILLPDDWDISYYVFNNPNVGSNPYNDNVIAASVWCDVLEPQGAAFFPAAGLRQGTNVFVVNSWGQYALSSAYDENQVYRFGFDETITVASDVGSSWRNICFSVRLAQDAAPQPSIQMPTVLTSDVSNITSNSAICGGEVTNDGGAEVTERGICWSTNANPSLNDSHVAVGTGIGAFNATVSGLNENTTYHVRAYAINEKGTAYGLDVEFATLPSGGTAQLPTIVTNSVTGITAHTAVCGGEVTSDGGAEVTERGICWSTNANPTISNSHTSAGSGMGAFSATMGGLSANTSYHVRAYATNEAGTAYGSDKEFTTLEGGGGNAPEGAVNGFFTINENGDQVYFSQGNLQYQASTNTWRFAENQWDYVGIEEMGTGTVFENGTQCDNSLISVSYSGWIDLFGWGTSGWDNGNMYYQPYDTERFWDSWIGNGYGPTDGEHYDFDLTGDYANADWGVYNAISNGGNMPNQWRTLTCFEWVYILEWRHTASGIRFAKGIVNGVNGVILLPDDWITSVYALYYTDREDAPFSTNEITAENWAMMESNGVVFLPTGGCRNSVNEIYTDGGYYWSTTAAGAEYARYMAVQDNYVTADSYVSGGYCGFSVRLVAPAEN